MTGHEPTYTASSPRVMIVDDEPMVTGSLGTLLRLETDYEVITYESAREALDSLAHRPVDLVISDFLMPEMDGLEFLRAVRERLPDVPRIILTGYADKENAITAINEVGLFQYLEKPWDNEHLKLVIRNGLEQHSLKQTLREKIRQLEKTIRDHDQLSEINQRLKSELEMARQLQQRLLPASFDDCRGVLLSVCYEPAFEIGGDFYDVVELADNRLAVLVADMTGHGVQAALSTALLKFAFSQYRGTDAASREILSGINEVLFSGLPHGIFAAAVVVTIDTTRCQCDIASAGVPYPILLRPEEENLEYVPAEGLLLGVVGPDQFQPGETQRVTLEPDHRLLLTTDGLTEARSPGGELFSAGMLENSLLSSRHLEGLELLRRLSDTVKDFCALETMEDDYTIMMLQPTIHRSDI